jgi:hypothetical protein
MKSYIKPAIEVVELTVKENIAALTQIPDGVTGVTNEYTDGGSTVLTTYALDTYNGGYVASV